MYKDSLSDLLKSLLLVLVVISLYSDHSLQLLTFIATLQCVKCDLITLNESVFSVLSEYASSDLITDVDLTTNTLMMIKAIKSIMLHQLLTHNSGMSYEFLFSLITE